MSQLSTKARISRKTPVIDKNMDYAMSVPGTAGLVQRVATTKNTNTKCKVLRSIKITACSQNEY